MSNFFNPDSRTMDINKKADPNVVSGAENTIYNENGDKILLDAQTSAIRVNDNIISKRTTWSSEKLTEFYSEKDDSDEEKIRKFTELYGEHFFADYDPSQDWSQIISDASDALDEGKAFYVPWNQNRIAYVYYAEPPDQLVASIDGLYYKITDDGLEETVVSGRLAKSRVGTVAEWAVSNYVPENGEFIIYSDRSIVSGVRYPGIKIGNGATVVGELPWVTDDLATMHFRGVTTTPITDGASTNPILINGESYTAVNGDMVIYQSSEFVFAESDERWHLFGDLNDLGSLAYQDNASGSYTPAGTVSTPAISVATAGAVDTIKNPTSVTVAKSVVASAPGQTAPDNSVTYYSVEGETLKLFQIGYTTGDSITTENKTVKVGDAAYEATPPAFTGTQATITVS